MRRNEPYLIWKPPLPGDQSEHAPRLLTSHDVRRLGWITAAITLAILCLPPWLYPIPALSALCVLSGYGAVGFIGLLMLLPLRRLLPWPNDRISVPLHQTLGLAALGLSLLHTLLFLLTEPLTIEYLKWFQPRFMIAGNIGLILLAVLVVTSLQTMRPKFFGARFQFRALHVIGSILFVLLLGAHLIGSSVYVEGILKSCVIAAVCAALVVAMLRKPESRAADSQNKRHEAAHHD